MAQTAILAVFPYDLSLIYIWSISVPPHIDVSKTCIFVRNY